MKKFSFAMTFLSILLLSGCYFSNQRIAEIMLDTYSDDQSYVALSGEIIEFSENYVVIKCEEISQYLEYQKELCDYYIHADHVLELSEGDQIDFITAPFHFYDGHKLPIVEVKSGEDTLLAFEDGKNNLIKWVYANFN